MANVVFSQPKKLKNSDFVKIRFLVLIEIQHCTTTQVFLKGDEKKERKIEYFVLSLPNSVLGCWWCANIIIQQKKNPAEHKMDLALPTFTVSATVKEIEIWALVVPKHCNPTDKIIQSP